MKEIEEKSISMSAEQVAEFKKRVIERSMKKFIISTVATKKKILEVTQDFVFPWAELEVENVDDHQDVVWVNMSETAKIPFNFIWEKSNTISTNYRLAKVL